MPRNGVGDFSLVTNSWNPATNNVLATAGDYQALINDIAAALTQSVSRDGQAPMTGNLALGNNKITGLSQGTGTGQALAFEQLFSQGVMQDVASSATTDIGNQNSNFLKITGNTTITSFGSNFKGPRFLVFEGAVTLTNSSTLVLPGGANITTAAGDVLIAIPGATLGTSDKWIVTAYQKNAVPGTVPDNSITPAKLTQKLTQGAAVTSTSGATIEFTGIPSWAKRITVMFSGVSTNGSSQYIIQIGSALGFENTGYVCTAMAMQSNTSYSAANATSGFVLMPSAFATNTVTWQGAITLSNLTSNNWVLSGSISRDAGGMTGVTIAGNKNLSGVLDRIRVATANGTDIFDAGSINILYE